MSAPDGASKEKEVINELNSFSLQDIGEFGASGASSGQQTQYTNGAGLKDRIQALLIAGASSAQTAAALGVTEAYVAQLRQNEQFSQEVVEKRAKARGRINDRYDEYELMLLDRLGEMLEMPTLKPHEIFKALQIVGTRKREAVLPLQEAAARNGSTSVVVNLQLSPQVAQRFILDAARKDIIGIAAGTVGQEHESVAFIPMPSAALISEAKLSEVKQSASQQEIVQNERESLQKKDPDAG